MMMTTKNRVAKVKFSFDDGEDEIMGAILALGCISLNKITFSFPERHDAISIINIGELKGVLECDDIEIKEVRIDN